MSAMDNFLQKSVVLEHFWSDLMGNLARRDNFLAIRL